MKRLLTLIVILLTAQVAYGSIAKVQDTSNSSTSATVLTKAYTSSPGSAHLLIAVAGCFAGFCSSNSITSTNNGTWPKVLSINHGLEVSVYYICNSVPGAETVTLTSSGSSFEMHLHIYEFSGILSSSCLDQQGTATPSSGTTFSATTSGSVSQAEELLFGAVSDNDSPPPHPINGTGTWTAYQNTATTQYAMATMTSSVTTGLSGTQTVTASIASGNPFWSGAIVTFKGAPAVTGSAMISPIIL